MPGVQAELSKSQANLIGDGARSGSTSPPVRSAGVFESQFAAIGEMQCGLRERRICDILCGLCSGVISSSHTPSVSVAGSGSPREEALNLRRNAVLVLQKIGENALTSWVLQLRPGPGSRSKDFNSFYIGRPGQEG